MLSSLRLPFLYLVVIFSGLSLPIFRADYALIVITAMALCIYPLNFLFKRPTLVCLVAWTLYFCCSVLYIGAFNPLFYINQVCLFLLVFSLAFFWGNIFPYKIARVISDITLVVFPLYILQTINPSIFFELIKPISLSGELFDYRLYESVGFYTFHQVDLNEPFPRNTGFCWEPGPFSVYCAFSIFFLLQNGSAHEGVKKIGRYRYWILAACIVTTQSSTGYALAMLLGMWRIIRIFKFNAGVSLLVPIFFVAGFALIQSISILGVKVGEEAAQDIDALLMHSEENETTHAAGRFGSLVMRYRDFQNFPLFGTGGSSTLVTGYFGPEHSVAAISGIGKILGQYGLAGVAAFLFLMSRCRQFYSRVGDYTSGYVFVGLVIGTGISFSIIEGPLIISLILFPLVVQGRRNHLRGETLAS